MLTIHTARENLDKEKFLFSEIGQTISQISERNAGGTKRVLLLVPEQFTLQSELNAFEYLQVPGFLTLDILSMSSLGRRIFAEQGGGNEIFISKYGKYMLLSKLLHRHKNKMESFRNLEASPQFVMRMDNMITEMKNFNIDPGDLQEIIGKMREDSLIRRKLSDVARIYADYNDILGKEQLDAADYLKNFTAKIVSSEFIRESEIWVSGFDYFSPALMDTMIELVKRAVHVSVLITGDLSLRFFSLTTQMANELVERASNAGTEGKILSVEETSQDAFQKESASEIRTIESVWCGAKRNGEPASLDGKDKGISSLKFAAAANFYAEAELAAAEVRRLVRDEGYRYNDILLLCNDMKVRAPMIKRVFSDFDLPIFLDERRTILHHPVLEYVLLLPEIVANGRSIASVFRLLKTGLSPVPRDLWEALEKYAKRYKIQGKRWETDFQWGDENTLPILNEGRKEVIRLLMAFENAYRESGTAAEKTDSLYRFLVEDAMLPNAIERMAEEEETQGRVDKADEMRGVWKMVLDVLFQMKVAIGDLPMSRAEYALVLRTGFESMNMGVLPPGKDQIVLGTMQRTRRGRVKAIFILGANDGLLPASEEEKGIISSDEKLRLEQSGFFLGRSDDTVLLEEQLAIYRNLAKASDFLYVSYAASDANGKDLRPSNVFRRLTEMFPTLPVATDFSDNAETGLPDAIQAPAEAMTHLSRRLAEVAGNVRFGEQEEIEPAWRGVYRWFADSETYKARLDKVRNGMLFEGKHARIDASFLARLGEIQLSSSALELYSRCPFSWFLRYGLKLEEDRVFELDSRHTGDVFHHVFMTYGQEMEQNTRSVSDPDSRWQTLSEGESRQMVETLFSETIRDFEGGLFHRGPIERYRSKRMGRIVADAAWAITRQIREGQIEQMYFETDFARNGRFPPIMVKGSDVEGHVMIRGRIDRIDVLRGDYVRVIDYKTGAEKFSPDDVMQGWQMQLMTYLQAVSARYKPAGVFYFKAKEPHINEALSADLVLEVQRGFKPEGIALEVTEAEEGAGGKSK
ncbi:MAG: PD-(D/E)XK nuclease family protein [Clostridiales Family XIII bacterium]|jgi:ATP-dependent helicase/nuclease subunit B|nr:PD-(D/E)XK nuclease family protein [Clostridiales Family XIII bacterium]